MYKFLKAFKTAINSNKIDPSKLISRYDIYDNNGNWLETFRAQPNNFNCLHMYLKTYLHCKIESIEPIHNTNNFMIHAMHLYSKKNIQLKMIRW